MTKSKNPLVIVSDIHSNATAYSEVILDIRKRIGNHFDFACLGDIIDYGPDHEECIAITMEIFAHQMEMGNKFWAVAGNHEDLVFGRTPASKLKSDRGRNSLHITKQEIDKMDSEYVNFLYNMPITIIDKWNGKTLIIKHWSLTDTWVSNSGELEISNMIVLYGHTHVPKITKHVESKSLIINPGSVGQPRDGQNTASYTVVYPDLSVKNYRVPYDIEEVISRMPENQHQYYSERLRVGK